MEEERIDLVKDVTVLCKSDRKRFTNDTRLKAIKKAVQSTPFQAVYKGKLTHMYAKLPIEEMTGDIVVISSHVDFVPDKAFAEYEEEEKVLRGTFDNSITNAAACVLMREYVLPPNVIFAFTGDEETGGCRGAKEVVEVLKKLQSPTLSNVTVLALDVTFMGFEKKKFCTIENDYLKPSAQKRLVNTAYGISNDLPKAGFSYVPSKRKVPGFVKKTEIEGTSWFDEGAAYYRYAEGICSASVCIPCGKGDMHGQSGVTIEYPVFSGYIKHLKMLTEALLGKRPVLLSCKEEYQTLCEMEEARKKAYEELLKSRSEYTYCGNFLDDWEAEYGYDYDNAIAEFVEYVEWFVDAYSPDEDGLACFLNDLAAELPDEEDINPALYGMESAEEVLDYLEVLATEIFMDHHGMGEIEEDFFYS